MLASNRHYAVQTSQVLLYGAVPACILGIFGDFLQPEEPRGRAGRSQMRCLNARRQEVTSLLNLVCGPWGGWMGYVWCLQSQPAVAGVTQEGRGLSFTRAALQKCNKRVGFEELSIQEAQCTSLCCWGRMNSNKFAKFLFSLYKHYPPPFFF